MLSLVRPQFGLEECDFVTMISTLHKKYKVILEVQRETVSDSFPSSFALDFCLTYESKPNQGNTGLMESTICKVLSFECEDLLYVLSGKQDQAPKCT